MGYAKPWELANGSYSICGDCGLGFGVSPGRPIGMWHGKCDICGNEGFLANAAHDFGLVDDEVDEIICATLSVSPFDPWDYERGQGSDQADVFYADDDREGN